MDEEAEVQRKLIPKISHRVLFLSILSVFVVLIVTIGVYYILTNENSHYDEDLDDATPQTANWVNNPEIRIIRKYLQFKTVSLNTDFDLCVRFLEDLADDLDLEVTVLNPVNDENPVVVMTWKGSHPELPSILLNSHMDVVPVSAEYWNHPPFGAKVDENGDIFARGAQDMKAVGMLYLAAIRSLKQKGIPRLRRTIHLTYVPDEESGGHYGAAPFVKSDYFKKMNVGFGLDEGYPSINQNLKVFYTEKPVWTVTVTANGHSGHASNLFNDTAVEKLNYIINKFMDFRRNESKKFNEQGYSYGNVTSINLTMLNGGMKENIVPPEMSAFFDIRMAIDADFDEFEKMIKRWATEAGKNVTLDIFKGSKSTPTPVDQTNPYWIAFKKATDELQLNVTPSVLHVSSDSRYIRDLHIPALGFTPLMNTQSRLHEHNEYINADNYLKAIPIYEKIIESLANIE